jgi:replicative superfamily II helicase
VRIVGLSTALANAGDLADWLGIEKGPHGGLFNFSPSVRPVPIDVHIAGYPGKHYCPRMATMNRPAYASIQQYAEGKPTLIFVASRRQTRLTALELIALSAASDAPRQWVGKAASGDELATFASTLRDPALRDTVPFGVGIHHAGLCANDRNTVETLFREGKLLVLVCTSTLAWGVNFPARLVIIKGTEYFDAKTHRYVDFPITDVLQMMGRAGRPGHDTKGIACVLVHQPKKKFYQRFLYAPFPVESSLHPVLSDHLNAEVASGTIKSLSDGVDYITWTCVRFFFLLFCALCAHIRRLVPRAARRTQHARRSASLRQPETMYIRSPTPYTYALLRAFCLLHSYFFRRVLQNPSFYGLEDASSSTVHAYLSQLVGETLATLQRSECLVLDEDEDGNTVEGAVCAQTAGRIASAYYISHLTVRLFATRVENARTVADIASLLADAEEFAELPVRHNEEELNEQLGRIVQWPRAGGDYESAHCKTFLLLQTHLERLPLPIADYKNDCRTALSQVSRVRLSPRLASYPPHLPHPPRLRTNGPPLDAAARRCSPPSSISRRTRGASRACSPRCAWRSALCKPAVRRTRH